MRYSHPFLALLLVALVDPAGFVSAQTAPAKMPPLGTPQSVVRITLEEAKQKALANNKLLNIGSLNVEAKAHAVRAAKADYFPKISATAMYLNFGQDLGTVLTTQGRTVNGPLGRPLVTFPISTVNAAVVNENAFFGNLSIVQPVTDLLKVRQGVKIAQADEQIAQAQLLKGMRDVASGVEQLYWGLLAARRLQAGATDGVRGAEIAAKSGILEARIALVQGRQALQQINQQLNDAQEQLNGLLDLPLNTTLDLVEPPMPPLPYASADEVAAIALTVSPEMMEAQGTILKVDAAIAAGKLDYVPSVAIMGGYVNQTGASYIQQNIGYVGVAATYTFLDWGKRKSIIRERQTMGHMAMLKLQQTEDDIRQKAQKYFREMTESLEAAKFAMDMLQLRKEAEKKATTPEAAKNPTPLLAAVKSRMEAEVDAVKADLAYRAAYVQVMALTSK